MDYNMTLRNLRAKYTNECNFVQVTDEMKFQANSMYIFNEL